ncbi:hypothetical protein GCM10009678_45050 [Actinomadura kijaniata]|uniref:hypothetical protein n=1 Tax=Actinomadura kijaniata TaxID=46161 RepID=UPI002FE741ED
MAQEGAFGRIFNRDRRLRRRWTAALAEPDPARALARLREIRDGIAADPAGTGGLWPEFQAAMLDPRLLPLLTGDDFAALEDAGARTGAGAWWPLIAARAARGEEREARELIGRCPPSLPPEWTGLARELLRVDFGSGLLRVREAGEAARRLAVPGLEGTLALHALLVGDDPARAAALLEHAPADETAFAALLAARLRLGEHAAVAALAARPGRPTSRAIEELAELGRALHWLDTPDPTADSTADPTTGPVPVERLVRFTVALHAGEWLDYAIGRTYLLDGDARRAARVLVPLADAFPGRPDWAYHAAWALLLTGDHEGIARLHDRSPTWATACLLRDAAPDTATPQTAPETAPPAAYADLAAARAALAGGARVPIESRDWLRTGGPLGDHLEALRTVLGLRYARRAAWPMTQAVESPLFQRLPAPERLRWQGLAALLTDPGRGRALLTEAARVHGYGRAALALAVHEAREGDLAAARRLLDGPPRLEGRKPELLRTWLQARDDDADHASPDRLDALAGDLSRARHAAAHLRLRRAVLGQDHSDTEEVRRLLAEAARAFGVPGDPRALRALARAAEALATGEPPVGEPAALRRAVPGHPWATWVLGLAELSADGAGADPALAARLAAMAEGSARADAVLAAALAGACLRAAEHERGPFADLLAGRAAAHDHPEVRRLHGLVHGAGFPVALTAARRALTAGDRDAALAALRDAPAAGPVERRIRDLLAAALAGEPGDAELPEGLPAPLTALLATAQAAALAGTDPQRCRTLLLRALPHYDVTRLVDLGRALPALCAAPGQGGGARPRELSALDRRAAADDGFDPLTLARCATAVGDHQTADKAWRTALRGTDDPAVREEYGGYLCHRAVVAHRDGGALEAARLLRGAARILDGQEPSQFLPDEDEVAEIRRVYEERLAASTAPRRRILTAEWNRADLRYRQAAASRQVAKALVHFEEMRSLAATGSLRARWED